MSTGCEFYGDALVELARGGLEPERVQRVEAHLAECEACRADLAVIRAVESAPAAVPEGLQSRIREAVRGGAERSAPVADAPGVRTRRAPVWHGWRPWALPVAAAAALALWLGAAELVGPGAESGASDVAVEAVEYDPYGAWPGSSGVVAGEVVLSELSVEELEALLEELDS